jgi:polyadenylate-binding protein
VAAAVPDLGPSFAARLAAATPEVRRELIGAKVFGKLAAAHPEMAGKIAAKLLDNLAEMDLLALLSDPDALAQRAQDALATLGASA